jgi:hypothetical protein
MFHQWNKALWVNFLLVCILQGPAGDIRTILFAGVQALLFDAETDTVNDVPDGAMPNAA